MTGPNNPLPRSRTSLFSRSLRPKTPQLHIPLKLPIIPIPTSPNLPPDPNPPRRRRTSDQKPALKPSFHKPRLERTPQRFTHHALHLGRQIAPQQQRARNNIRRGDLRDDEGQVSLCLVEQRRRDFGQHVEGLQDGIEGRQQDDAGEEEGDLAGPGELVECRRDVFCEEGEDAVYWVHSGGGGECWVGGGEEDAPEGREGGGEDAVDAVDSEGVGGGR